MDWRLDLRPYFITILSLFAASTIRGGAPIVDSTIDLFDFPSGITEPSSDPSVSGINESAKPQKKGEQILLDSRVPKKVIPTIRVLVDAGHGGRDDGAIGHLGIIEKEITLQVAKLLKTELRRYKKFSLDVKLSRESDLFLNLRERVEFANEWGADLFVSIHANSSTSIKPKGFEVYFLSPEASDEEAARLARVENETRADNEMKPEVLSILSDSIASNHVIESSRFAEAVYRSLARAFRANGKGVRQGPFTVLSGTHMPAVLIELGFVTNLDDAANLKKSSYLKTLAGAISSGIVEYSVTLRKFS